MQAGERAAAVSCISRWLCICFVPRSCCAEGCSHKRPCRIRASACRTNVLDVTEGVQYGAVGSRKACRGPEVPTCQHHEHSLLRSARRAHALPAVAISELPTCANVLSLARKLLSASCSSSQGSNAGVQPPSMAHGSTSCPAQSQRSREILSAQSNAGSSAGCLRARPAVRADWGPGS
jgi:hypothetical protein